jgi:hypothetical protein
MNRVIIRSQVTAPRGRRLSGYLPIAAIAAFVSCVGFVVWSGAVTGTLGFDFLAYHQAANRLLAGLPLYDPALKSLHASGVSDVGAVVPFLYPPPFALAFIPLAPLPSAAAGVVWLGLSLMAVIVAIWVLPISAQARWVTLLLAGLSWPVAYAMKLGQVSPLLLLLFAVGWRYLARPAAVGLSAGMGALVKIQPALLLLWALVTRRWMVAVVGVAFIILAAGLSILAAGGVSDWTDYVALLRAVGDPVATPGNLSPGAVIYRTLNVPIGFAAAIQAASSAGALVFVALSVLRGTPVSSYLAAVIASQLVSPVIWEHYAMLLLLPVAWLMDKGHSWSIAVPLVTSVFVFFWVPPVIYPAAFWLTLVATVAIGWRERGERSPAANLTASS